MHPQKLAQSVKDKAFPSVPTTLRLSGIGTRVSWVGGMSPPTLKTPADPSENDRCKRDKETTQDPHA